MDNYYHHYWQGLWAPRPIRRAVAISLAAHLVLGVFTFEAFKHRPPVRPPMMHYVQFVPVQQPEPPKPEPEIKPEPEKPKPKPPEPKPKPKPKPPEPKPKPKPKPKPEPKPEPKPKPPEKKPEPAPKPEPKKPARTGVTMKQELPTVLDSWGRNVQRKVEKHWRVPSGIRLDLENDEAEVAFWVDRRGQLLGEPEIIKPASDPMLGESGVRAIKLAAPLPPLPEDYKQPEQQVVYVFGLVR